MTIYCPDCAKPKRWWQKSLYDVTWSRRRSYDEMVRVKATHYRCFRRYVRNKFKSDVKEQYGRPPQ